jgi:cytochrome c oxidase subunit 2
MPIEVRVVSEKDYTAWLEQAKQKYANEDSPRATTLAAAQ